MPRIPVSWLNEFLVPAMTADDVDRLLGEAGIAVTAVVRPGAADPHVVVGRVEDAATAPGYRIVSVPTPELVRAPAGPSPGTPVAVALPGAWLFDPTARYGLIRVPGPRRGQDSMGVVCDGAVLGLGADVDPEAFLRAANAAAGVPVAGLLPPQREQVLTVTVPDTLVHASGLWGLAGELVPRRDGSLRARGPQTAGPAPVPMSLTVERPGWTVAATVVAGDASTGALDAVHRWAVLAGLWSGRSLEDSLCVVGFEYGVRLAAFRLDGTGPAAVVVGTSGHGARPVTQSGWPPELPVGLLGGRSSGRLVVLSASLTPRADGTMRCQAAARRLAELLGAVDGDPVVAAGPQAERSIIHIGLASLADVLGTSLDRADLGDLAGRIGADVEVGTGDRLGIMVPVSRPDLSTAEALTAEFVRLLGYRRLRATVPTDPVPQPAVNERGRSARTEQARAEVAARGYRELVSPFAVVGRPDRPSWFAGARELLATDARGGVRLVRRSLLPGIETAFAAQPADWSDGAAFELGTVVRPDLDGACREGLTLAVVRVGDAATIEGRCADVVAAVVAALRAAGCAGVDLVPGAAGEMDVEGDLVVSVVDDGRRIGHIGVLDGFGAGQLVAYAEVELDPVLARPARVPPVQAPPPRPATVLDVTLLVPDALSTGDLVRGLGDGVALLNSTRVVDVYRGPTVPIGHRAVTLRLEFSSPWRTVTTQEARRVSDSAVAAAGHLGVRRR